MSRRQTGNAVAEAVRWFNRFRMDGPTALSPDESAEWARWSANKDNLREFGNAEQLTGTDTFVPFGTNTAPSIIARRRPRWISRLTRVCSKSRARR